MPTSKPRIAITLDPRVYATIERLAQLQGKSRGSVVADLVTSIHEPLMRTVALLDAAAEAPEQVKAGLRGVIEGVESQLVGAAGGGLAQLDWLRARVQAARSGARPARERSEPQAVPKRPKRGSNPRASNTGVRSRRKGGRR